MLPKKEISRMPKVAESFESGGMQILDFGFRILDLKTIAVIEPLTRTRFNPKSKFQNPKLG
jgi:hypothetical protein